MTNTARRVRVDRLRGGELVIGTGPSGPYLDGPRRVAKQPEHTSEHSVRTAAYWVEWTGGERQVYYGDTVVLVAR